MQQFFNILNDFFLTKSVELLEIKYIYIHPQDSENSESDEN